METRRVIGGLRRLALAALGVAASIGMAAAAAAPAADAAAQAPLGKIEFGRKVGLASYSVRKFDLDQAIAWCKELGLKGIALKEFHMPIKSTPEERKAAAEKVRAAGLELTGGGVIYMKNADEKEIRGYFEYARDAGMPMIVAGPVQEALPIVDKMVKEFDIIVAIHNHGPGDQVYPSPLDAYKAAAPFDKRIGICIDIGHTVRNSEDPAAVIRQVADRLYDVHIKDVDASVGTGKTLEMGRGVIDIPAVIRALDEVGYDGWINLEYEKDADAPLPGMIESLAYLRGVIDGIDSEKK